MSSRSFIKNVPKVELHAHLSGSLSDETVTQFLKEKERPGLKEELPAILNSLKLGTNRSLDECFKIFHAIHLLTDSIECIRTITYNVIKEFYEDNVWYLELRTTPKAVQGVYTKQQYLEAVLQSVKEADGAMDIVVRLLISIDRGRGVEDGEDTLNLAKKLVQDETYGKYVCGIDVSGNPEADSLINYIPLLKEARNFGLKLAIHLLEVNTPVALKEAEIVIAEGLVDRIGHGTFLHPDSKGSSMLTDIVKKKKIPIEICITSNLKCGSVGSLEEHHLKVWQDEKHPLAVCTDDKGVFSTTLSEEMCLFEQAVQGNIYDVKNVTISSLQSSFLEEEEKKKLCSKMILRFEEIFRMDERPKLK